MSKNSQLYQSSNDDTHNCTAGIRLLYLIFIITIYENIVLLFVFLILCYEMFWPFLLIIATVAYFSWLCSQNPEYLSNWLQVEVYSVHLLRFNNKCSLNW